MRFTVDREVFIHFLNIVDSVVKVNATPIAILLNVYIEAQSDGTLILIGFNGETGTKIELKVAVDKPGKTTVLSKKLLEIVKKIEAEEILFQQEDEKEELLIQSINNTNPIFKLNTAQADSYPIFSEFNWQKYIRIYGKDLLYLINSTIFAISEDKVRAIAFTGAYVEESVEGNLTFVTSDGKRLALNTIEYLEKKGTIDLNIIIPEHILKVLLGAVEKDEEVLFSVDKNQAFFKVGNVYLYSNLIDGRFPDYKAIIPNERNNHGIVKGSEFLQAIEDVSIMSDSEKNMIKLDVSERKMEISAQSQAHGVALEKIEVKDYYGSPIIVFCNYRQLLDFIKIFKERDIYFSINSKASPLLFLIEGEKHFLHLVMPLRE